MAIFVDLDVMLARRKMRSRELAQRIGVAEQNASLLKSGAVKGIRFDTLAKICEALDCRPGDILDYRPEKEGGDVTPLTSGRHRCRPRARRRRWSSDR
ncbi:helix-turn-helix transcriptional regulator [Methylosinus sp. Sm6]|uniref:helix-turn-helix domain-containing protein n=1 Tax=Methylosinus sp. Sm6 TaxID=2866948 RepID=UPI001C99EF0B|nr:helix-turn-helix transcriptional regulator [Methylosinus sp. Sm6]MBY6240299.1 helix-turn-helix transcriptional regulator [Methylosinus sp. Sm6]